MNIKRKLSLAAVGLLAAFAVTFTLPERSEIPSDLLYQPQMLAVIEVDPDGAGPLPGGSPRLEGSVVIDFVDGFRPQELRRFNEETGLEARYHSIHSLNSGLTVATVAEEELGAVIARLQTDPRVEAVNPNYYYQLTNEEEPELAGGFPNDPEYKYQWHMDQIRSKDAWRWTSGRGVVVAVVDTGVTHADSADGVFHVVEDLKDTLFVPGYDFVNNRTDAYDDHCHGTHVAGTIAQSTNNGKGVTGVAFGASVMPVKVLSGRGGGTNAGVADGIRFAADNGAKVMNLSLGGSAPSSVLDKAVAHAVKKGSLVVCAAGNSGQPRSGYPAACEGAISVSALDFHENLTFYSNYGSSIDIAAPGGDTRADKNGDGMPDGVYQNTIALQNPGQSGYYNFQGTSMATPHVAGVYALGASLGVTKAEALEQLVYQTARPAPEGAKEGYGAGVLDAGAVTHLAGFVYGQKKLLFGLAAGILAFAFYFRRRRVGSIILALPGVMLGSCGILWLVPALGLNDAPLSPFLVNGLPAWDLFVLGTAFHGSPFTHSLLIPMLVCLFTLPIKFLRPLAAGLAAGVAGHLAFVATHGTLDMFWLPEGLQNMWLWANAFVCVTLATGTAAGE